MCTISLAILYAISTLDYHYYRTNVSVIINDNVTRRCEPLKDVYRRPTGSIALGAAAGNEECANVLEDLEPFKHQL